mgnify:CR=1 FL=1
MSKGKAEGELSVIKSVSEKEERKTYLDYLRVLATLAVMIIHISAQNWYRVDVNSSQWRLFNFYDAIVRWSVPAFVMISGSIFLSRDIPIKKIYGKYVLRMLIAYSFWSFVYYLFQGNSIKESFIQLFTDKSFNPWISLIQGHYHMWFILMIVGLYVCVPLFKRIVSDSVTERYFLIVGLIVTIVFPSLINFFKAFGGERTNSLLNAVYSDFDQLRILTCAGYAFYFVLGHYLVENDLNKQVKRMIYILGTVGFALTVFLSLYISVKRQYQTDTFYDPFSINVFFETIFVFMIFKGKRKYSKRTNQIIRKLSEYSFGAYLVHLLVIELALRYFEIHTMMINPLIMVPLMTIGTFIVSFAVSAILHQIPLLKKYVV